MLIYKAKNYSKSREIRRSAFRAWQQQQYGQAALAKIFLKFPLANIDEILVAWQGYVFSKDYKEQRLRHLSKDHRSDTACQPPVPSQSNDPHVQGLASGSSQRSTFIASRDAPQSIDNFRQYAADYAEYGPRYADLRSSCSARRGSPFNGRVPTTGHNFSLGPWIQFS